MNKQKKMIFHIFSRSPELSRASHLLFDFLSCSSSAWECRKIKKNENVFPCIRKIWYYFNEIRFSRFFFPCCFSTREEEENLSNFDMLAFRPQNDSTDDTENDLICAKGWNFFAHFDLSTAKFLHIWRKYLPKYELFVSTQKIASGSIAIPFSEVLDLLCVFTKSLDNSRLFFRCFQTESQVIILIPWQLKVLKFRTLLTFLYFFLY